MITASLDQGIGGRCYGRRSAATDGRRRSGGARALAAQGVSIALAGYRGVMPRDPVPEADRLEQEMPPDPDALDVRGSTRIRPLPLEATEADVIEQELPLAEDVLPHGVDAERSESTSDEDWVDPPDERGPLAH